MGTSNSHFNSLVWFLGRVEYVYCGRLWARFNSSADQPLQDPASPQLLCQMALASERRVATLVDKLFCHSVILRAPVCRLLSDQWSSLKAAAATELLAIGAGCTATTNYTLPAEMLYALRITKAVLPIAIEQCLMSQPTDAVLLAFREVALSRSRGQEMGTVVYNKLQQLLPCSFCIPTACRLKYCGECDGTLTVLFSGYPSCGTAPCMIHRNRLANPSLMSPSEHISGVLAATVSNSNSNLVDRALPKNGEHIVERLHPSGDVERALFVLSSRPLPRRSTYGSAAILPPGSQQSQSIAPPPSRSIAPKSLQHIRYARVAGDPLQQC